MSGFKTGAAELADQTPEGWFVGAYLLLDYVVA